MSVPKLRFKADDGCEFPEWEEKRLGDICTINPTTNKLAETFYYIDLDSVTDGKLTLKDAICKENAPSRAQRVLSDNDVLFQSVRPYQKNHYYFKDTFGEQVVASTGYCQLRMKNGDNRFLYQLLYTDSVSDEVDKRCTGSNYPAINSNSLSKIKVYVPSSTIEQKRIAACLSTLDHVINQTQSEIDAWEKQKRGVMQLLFSRKVRFKADDGSEFPEWEGYNAERMFDNIVDKGHSSETVLTIVQGKGTVPRNEAGRNIQYDFEYLCNYKKVQKNDFIIHLRSFEGGLEIANEDGIVSPAYIILRNKLKMAPFFYYAYFHTNIFINQSLAKAVEGIRDGRQISYNAFKKLTIPYPCLEEQQKIAACLSAFDAVIDKAKQELSAYRELKKGLLQQMFV